MIPKLPYTVILGPEDISLIHHYPIRKNANQHVPQCSLITYGDSLAGSRARRNSTPSGLPRIPQLKRSIVRLKDLCQSVPKRCVESVRRP